MTEPNDTSLRRRRAQAHLEADPLQAWIDERADYERVIEEMVASHEADLEALRKQIANAEVDYNEMKRQADNAGDLLKATRKEYESEWARARSLIEGQPEAQPEGQLIVRCVERLVTRLTNERNASVEKVGEVIALLERVEPFLNKCRRMLDNQSNLSEFRREASILYSGIGTERATGPFMASLVATVRAAAELHLALNTQVMGESVKKADLRLGTELAGVPSVFKKITPDAKVPLMKQHDIRAENEAWAAEQQRQRAEEATARTMKTLDLIKATNGTSSSNAYAERRDAAAAKRPKGSKPADVTEADYKDIEQAKQTLEAWAKEGKIMAMPELIELQSIPADVVNVKWEDIKPDQRAGFQLTTASNSSAIRIGNGGSYSVGESWQSVEGWPAVPDESKPQIGFVGPAPDYGQPIMQQWRDAKGVITRIKTAGGTYRRNRDGTFEQEIESYARKADP